MAEELECPWTLAQFWSGQWILFGGNYATEREALLHKAALEPFHPPLRVVHKEEFQLTYEGRKATITAQILANPLYQPHSLLMRSLSKSLVSKLSLIELNQLETIISQKKPELTKPQQHANELLEALKLVLIYMGDYGTHEDTDDPIFVAAQRLVKTVMEPSFADQLNKLMDT